jgi:heptosyltransferase-2
MHLTNLLHIPLIAIFGSTVKEFGFFPTGKNSFVIENADLNCRPCSHIGLSSCPKKHFKCMNDINEKLIVEKAISFLFNV